MNLINQLVSIIRKIRSTNNKSLLMDFVNKNSEQIANITDEKELRRIIKYLMFTTNGTNYHWRGNEKINKNPLVKEVILEYIMRENIYEKSSISYSDVLSNLKVTEFPNDFCKYFLQKDLSPIDIIEIASIMYKIDKNSYEKFMKKYKNQKFTTFEIEYQIYLIIEQDNFDFIIHNMDFILNNFQSDKLIELYNSIKKNDECRKVLEEYMIKNLNSVLRLNIENVSDLLSYINKDSKLYKEIIVYLKNNIDAIIKKEKDSIDLFDIKAIYEEHEELKPIAREYFNEHKDEIIERMYKHITYLFVCYEDNQSEYKKERKAVKEIMKLIIEELCEKEKVEFGDITKLGEGGFSKVYQINNKVIKLGIHRNTRTIPENPYIVKPLLRKNFSVDGKEFGEQLFIEVTERVIPLAFNMSPDEIDKILYSLYEKQRDIGIEWKDIRIDNVGILLKDNIIHWPSKLEPQCKELGLIPQETDIMLKKGDYVVLDADLQYTEEAFKERYPKINQKLIQETFNAYWLEYHNRYNKEHKRKVIKI